MLKITNISHNTQRFTTRTGRRVEIEPGSTENVAVAADDPRVAARVNARLIKVEDETPKKAKASDQKASSEE